MVGSRLSTAAKIRAAEPTGFLHTLRNGTAQRVIAYNISESRALAYLEFSAPPKGTARARAILWEREGKKIVAVKASENGELWRVGTETRSRIRSMGSKALSECPPIGNDPGYCWSKRRKCTDWDIFNCGAAVVGVPLGTLACLASLGSIGGAIGGCGMSALGVAAFARECCTSWCWVWTMNVPGCGPN